MEKHKIAIETLEKLIKEKENDVLNRRITLDKHPNWTRIQDKYPKEIEQLESEITKLANSINILKNDK